MKTTMLDTIHLRYKKDNKFKNHAEKYSFVADMYPNRLIYVSNNKQCSG
jgi:thymidylate kinase